MVSVLSFLLPAAPALNFAAGVHQDDAQTLIASVTMRTPAALRGGYFSYLIGKCH